MLSKEERKERNTEFWTTFRTEMRRIPSCDGRSIDWIKYPLNVKDLYLRLEADGNGARVCFDIQPKDDGIRSIIWEQMTELKAVMESEMGAATAWVEFHDTIGGKNISRIYWENPEVNFYRDEDFPEIRSFLKDRLVGFDRFYQEFKEILLTLVE